MWVFKMRVIRKDGYEAEKNILGTTFRELSIGLVAEWELSDLLKQALSQPTSDDRNIKAITYGNYISDLIIDDKLDFELITSAIAKDTKHSENYINKVILENISAAKDTYQYYLKQ